MRSGTWVLLAVAGLLAIVVGGFVVSTGGERVDPGAAPRPDESLVPRADTPDSDATTTSADPPSAPERRELDLPPPRGAAPASAGPVHAFRIRFHDGSAAPRVPLAVWQGRDAYARWPIFVGRSDTEGLVRIPDLEKRAKPEPDTRFVATVMVPAEHPVTREFDATTPSAEPIDLVLPPVGPVDVELVDRHGTPIPLDVDLWIGARHAIPGYLHDGIVPEWCDRPSVRRDVGTGPARFDHVALGGQVGVYYAIEPGTDAGAPLHAPVAAPWQSLPMTDEPVDPLRVELADSFAVATGRILDTDGAPLGDRVLDLSASTAYFRCGPLRTSDDGRFALLLHREFHDVPFELVLEPEGESRVAACPMDVETWGEVFDLGDLPLSEGLLGLAGRLLDEGGEPVPGRTLFLETRFKPDDPTDGRWIRLPGRAAISDAQGRFELRVLGRRDPVRARLAPGTGFCEVDSPICAFGTTDVVVRMLPNGFGSVSAKIRGRDGCSLQGLGAWLTSMDSRGQPIRGTVFGASATAVFFAVPPGRYRFVVGWSREEPLATVDDVVVRAGEKTDDPRLQDVELAGAVFWFEVSLVDRSGDLLPDLHGTCVVGVPGSDVTFGVGSKTSVLAFAAPAPAVRIEILRSGFRPRELEVRHGSTTVALDPARTIRIVLPELRQLVGRGVPIRVLADWTDPAPARQHGQFSRSSYSNALNTAAVLDDHGAALVPFARSGRYGLIAQIGAGRAILGEIEIDVDALSVTALTFRDGWREQVLRFMPKSER